MEIADFDISYLRSWF